MAKAAKENDKALKPFHAEKKAHANLGYNASVLVGGSSPDRFVPNINASFTRKRSDEFFLNVNASDVVVGNESPVISDRPEVKVGDRTDKYYVDSKGNLEYEIIFDKKSLSNVVSLGIECSKALEFYYQPALTQEEIDEGIDRPEDIIDSYAVYCDKENNEYQTGKVAHIKRAFVIDKNGVKTWCSQTIEVIDGIGIWRITIPEEIFSDSSLYPLVIGPTLGFATQGGTGGSADDWIGSKVTATEDGVLDGTGDIWLWLNDVTATYAVQFAIYDDDGSGPDNLLTASDQVDSNLVQYSAMNLTSKVTGLSHSFSTDEVLWILMASEASNCALYYDVVSGLGVKTWKLDIGNPEDPFDQGSANFVDRKHSIWVDYTLASVSSSISESVSASSSSSVSVSVSVSSSSSESSISVSVSSSSSESSISVSVSSSSSVSVSVSVSSSSSESSISVSSSSESSISVSVSSSSSESSISVSVSSSSSISVSVSVSVSSSSSVSVSSSSSESSISVSVSASSSSSITSESSSSNSSESASVSISSSSSVSLSASSSSSSSISASVSSSSSSLSTSVSVSLSSSSSLSTSSSSSTSASISSSSSSISVSSSSSMSAALSEPDFISEYTPVSRVSSEVVLTRVFEHVAISKIFEHSEPDA